MKKTLLTTLLVVIMLGCFAQSKFGLFAGPQITSSKYTINGKKQSNTAKYGFQIGANYKIPFENKLYFSPAVFYSLKGYNVKFNQPAFPPDSLAVDNNTQIHTFELAALLQYDFNTNLSHFFIRLGPSLDFQLAGKEKFKRSNRTSGNRDMSFSFTASNRYAANLLFQLGCETKQGWIISAQYSRGIGSINNADFGPGIWHRAIGISIGKYLNGKK